MEYSGCRKKTPQRERRPKHELYLRFHASQCWSSFTKKGGNETISDTHSSKMKLPDRDYVGGFAKLEADESRKARSGEPFGWMEQSI